MWSRQRPMGAALHAEEKQGRHFRQDLGTALELFPEAFFLLFQETQAMVTDLGQSDALDGSASRSEDVLALLTLAGKTFPVSADQLVVNHLPLLFCHFLQSLDGVMRKFDIQVAENLRFCCQ